MASRMGREVVFYNLATAGERHLSRNAADRQIMTEMHALIEEYHPVVAGTVEAIGHKLDRIPGYRLVRDTSTPSRANIAAYVDATTDPRRYKWTDLKQTWGKTNPGALGRHPPRSILSFLSDHAQFVVAHLPPKGTDNVLGSQGEEVRALRGLMGWRLTPIARNRPRILIADFNRTATEPGPGPLDIARGIGGHVVDLHRVDSAVVRNAIFSRVRYPSEVHGVKLHSDHGSAMVFHVRY